MTSLKERAAELKQKWEDLLRQATVDRSHYYVAATAGESALFITDLLAALETAENDALERAAKEADKIASNTSDFDRDRRRGAGMAGAAIRVLKTGETP